MTIERLKDMGYQKVGEIDEMEVWSNFHSTSSNKENITEGFIFQFNLKLQQEHIGQILANKEILEKIING